MYCKAIEILNKLIDSGYKAYIIGGYPRDKYLGQNSNDIDICTDALPEEISILFNDCKLIGFGCSKIKYNGYTFEITTFREDIETINNRYPKKTKYVVSLEEDLKRRDFIINTLCIDHNGNYIDLLDAKKDLNDRVIKTVMDSDISFYNDALRILRAIRFSLQLNFDLSVEISNSIYKNGYLLKNISFYHKKKELDKIFSYENGVYLLKKYNLLEYLDIYFCKEDVSFDNYLEVWSNLTYSDRYKFSKKEQNFINRMRNNN